MSKCPPPEYTLLPFADDGSFTSSSSTYSSHSMATFSDTEIKVTIGNVALLLFWATPFVVVLTTFLINKDSLLLAVLVVSGINSVVGLLSNILILSLLQGQEQRTEYFRYRRWHLFMCLITFSVSALCIWFLGQTLSQRPPTPRLR